MKDIIKMDVSLLFVAIACIASMYAIKEHDPDPFWTEMFYVYLGLATIYLITTIILYIWVYFFKK